jgi:hypothetical protein
LKESKGDIEESAMILQIPKLNFVAQVRSSCGSTESRKQLNGNENEGAMNSSKGQASSFLISRVGITTHQFQAEAASSIPFFSFLDSW